MPVGVDAGDEVEPSAEGLHVAGDGVDGAGCVTLLALIAATVCYLHMRMLVGLHGQPGWVAALTPLSVSGMIVAASTTLLADSRTGERGGILPWALLVAGSAASLAANVVVAQPTAAGWIIAAWWRVRGRGAVSVPWRELAAFTTVGTG